MAEFTFDTSGEVFIPDARYGVGATRIRWSDLDAFTQGYVEALFAASCDPVAVRTPEDDFSRIWDPDLDAPLPHDAGFRHLAPESLARIMADCAHFANVAEGLGQKKLDAAEGRRFWNGRQSRFYRASPTFAAAYPPLTVSLSDDGKVYFL